VATDPCGRPREHSFSRDPSFAALPSSGFAHRAPFLPAAERPIPEDSGGGAWEVPVGLTRPRQDGFDDWTFVTQVVGAWDTPTLSFRRLGSFRVGQTLQPTSSCGTSSPVWSSRTPSPRRAASPSTGRCSGHRSRQPASRGTRSRGSGRTTLRSAPSSPVSRASPGESSTELTGR
jgi:hypothetical protein